MNAIGLVFMLSTPCVVAQTTSTMEFLSADFTVAEDAGVAVITVVRTGNLDSVATVDLATRDGTVTAWEDYIPYAGTITFVPGETNKAVEITILDDGLVEGDETLALSLSNATGGVGLGSQTNALLRIRDNEIPTVLDPTFKPAALADLNVLTGLVQANGKIMVAGHDHLSRMAVVRLNQDGTQDSTFAFAGNIPANNITMALQPDQGLVLGASSSTGTRLLRLNSLGTLDPGFSPVVEETDTTISAGFYSIQVQPDGRILINGSFNRVNGLTRNGLARLNPDGSLDQSFVPAASGPTMLLQLDGKIVLAGTSLVRLLPDGTQDGGFTPPLGLTGPVALTPDGKLLVMDSFGCIQRLSASGTVDPSFYGCFRQAPQSSSLPRNMFLSQIAVRSDGKIFVNLNAIDPSTLPGVLVGLTADGAWFADSTSILGTSWSLLGFAADGSVLLSGAVQTNAGASQSVLFRLFPQGGAQPGLRFSPEGLSPLEDAGPAIITIQRTGDTTSPLTLNYATADGLAVAGQDYVAQTGTIYFAPLEISKTISVQLLDRPAVNPDRSFQVIFTNASLDVVTATATVTIRDDHSTFALQTAADAAESAGSVFLTVTRSGGIDRPVAVNFTTLDGSAHAGTDYEASAGTLRFEPGVTNQTIAISLIDNGVQDGNRRFSVQLNDPQGGVLGYSTTATVRILDDEKPYLIGWGWCSDSVPDRLVNIVAVAVGSSHCLALKSEGTVVGWGDNSAGQTSVPLELTNAIAIACGDSFSLALKSDGTVAAWGDNSNGQTTLPVGLSNVVAISAEEAHALALKANGTVVAWGDDTWGQSDVPASLSNVVATAAGTRHSVALKADGTLVAWGAGATNSGFFPNFGQSQIPPGLSNVVAIAAGLYHSMALKEDRTVVSWGAYSYNFREIGRIVPATAPTNSNVTRIAASGQFDMALTADGGVFVWGEIAPPWIPVGASAPVLWGATAISAGTSGGLGLVGGGPLPTTNIIKHPLATSKQFNCTVQTQNGKVYRLEYAESLNSPDWKSLPLTAGNGAEMVLIDLSAKSNQRFYRVRSW